MNEILEKLKELLNTAGITEKIFLNNDKDIIFPCIAIFSIGVPAKRNTNKVLKIFVNTRDEVDNILDLPNIIQDTFYDALSIETTNYYILAVEQINEFTWNDSRLIRGKKIGEANSIFEIIYKNKE